MLWKFSFRVLSLVRRNRALTLKFKLKCYVKPMKDPLGVSPSKGNQGNHDLTSELILCSTICVHSAMRHNIHMYPYFLFAVIHHLNHPQLSLSHLKLISSVTSAMLVMSDTPVDICLYMSTDIEARPHQFVSTMIIDTQAGFRMTFTVVLRCWKIWLSR